LNLADAFHWTRERLQSTAASLFVLVSALAAFVLGFQFHAIAAAETGPFLARIVRHSSVRMPR